MKKERKRGDLREKWKELCKPLMTNSCLLILTAHLVSCIRDVSVCNLYLYL